jgi:signal transduction histidine kinase
MRRLRVALLLLGLALAVPVMLLVARAREGERLEREMRHQAVAARAFDEMERQLTTVLEREEARPFEEYRMLVSSVPGAGANVPAFAIGFFQIDPDGRLNARPGSGVAEVAREALANGFDGPRRSTPPATTLLRRADGMFAMAKKEAPSAPPSDDAYDVISRLNLGQTSRAERKQKVRQEPIEKLYGERAEDAFELEALAPSEQRDRVSSEEQFAKAVRERARAFETASIDPRAASPAPTRDAENSPPRPTPGRTGASSAGADESDVRYSLQDFDLADRALIEEEFADRLDPPGLAAPELANETRVAATRGGASVRVALDPMVGLAVSDDHLLLYRTALVAELGYRQGVVIDRRELIAWLERRVLRRLGRFAELRFDVPDGAIGWAPSGRMVFGHRFGEPFDMLYAQLALAPLATPGGSSAFPIYALAGLLALVAAGGLFAVDRMVKVVVSFAERRNRFVASVSHELKTPLTAIRMYAEMLRDGLVADESKREEYYETITDESERLSRLIDNVLAFSKLERGQREIELAVGPVPEVLEEAADKLRPHAERQGFALRVAAEPGLPPVRFDRDALLQVLFNLVDNAMKYARPASPAEVVLEARAEGERVLVGVRDFGPGVDRKDLTRIFEPFYRVEAELTRSAKGTGIGLALVKELGQAMGAAVSGANADGGGFRVMLAFEPAGA